MMMEDNKKNALDALIAMLPGENSAVLVISPTALRYLCGFNVESGIILASKEARILFVPQRDLEVLKPRCRELEITALTSDGQMLDIIVKYGIKRIYVEADKMTVAEYNVFKEQLHYARLDTSSALDNALSELRTVKTEQELALIGNAQKICDKAYDRLQGSLRKGMSERQIASMLGYYLTKFGSEGGVPIKVLSGRNTADIELAPGDRQIADGDLLILEFGARFNGYCAKMCRTCAVGKIDPKLENAYNAVSCAIQDGLKALRAGVGSKVADSVARATLNAWGVDAHCSTTFAHGIGLESVEPPFLGRGSSVSLKANTALFVKVGVTFPGKFGVKLGDMAVLTDIGCTNLTTATKSLVHV